MKMPLIRFGKTNTLFIKKFQIKSLHVHICNVTNADNDKTPFWIINKLLIFIILRQFWCLCNYQFQYGYRFPYETEIKSIFWTHRVEALGKAESYEWNIHLCPSRPFTSWYYYEITHVVIICSLYFYKQLKFKVVVIVFAK